jgi:class 3 adenylate cyclase
LVSVRDAGIRRFWMMRALAVLAIVALGGLSGSATNYTGALPALGGPNGVLYDLTLATTLPWRRDAPAVPAVFVAVDEASLSSPELAVLPRALFQPIWARLIDGVMDAGAQRIAFDTVFAYAGADFRAGTYALPDYDQSLIDSLTAHRGKVVLGRFPSVPSAPAFAGAAGNSRVGVLDLQVESDGRVRSAAPLAQVAGGRIAMGFAALAAGLNVRQAASLERILIVPTAPLNQTPTYHLAALLDCMKSAEGARQLHNALDGRIVVVGTVVPGEDEHRGPTRFMGRVAEHAPAEPCMPQSGLIRRGMPEAVPGAFLQVAAIQSAASGQDVRLAQPWLRFAAAAILALAFSGLAVRDEGALTFGEHDVSNRATVLLQLSRTFAIGLAGPVVAGVAASALALTVAHVWLPLGYPVLTAIAIFVAIVSLRLIRHRALFRRLYRTAGRYLPPERLVVLARGGFVDSPLGEEREVSILLVDLIGFTTFSNEPGRTPSEVVATANHYFSLMQVAIDRHGGCSDKFLGDAVLAFWNGLSDEPEHAGKALAAAQDIIRAINEGDSGAAAQRLAVRAVVCTGKVYVGDLGADKRSNFTIIGPAVNETFRLERIPDLYGLPLALAAATADGIKAMGSESKAAKALSGGALVRVDDVELKGFSGARGVYAYVPDGDPGRAAFEAGRAALDRGSIPEGLTHLDRVQSGLLKSAARVVSARYRSRDQAA